MFLGMGAVFVGALAGVANVTGAISRARPADQAHTLGELTLVVRADPWQMTLRAPNGEVLWQESLDQTLSYRTTEGPDVPRATYGLVQPVSAKAASR